MVIFKQFSLEERISIQDELISRKSFKAIAEQLGKAPSSISREVRRHIEKKESGSYGRQFNDCANCSSCALENVCPRGSRESWYVLSGDAASTEIFVDYARRFGIEEGFRDEKSGGCELEASRIRDAKKLERFLLVVSTALIVGVSEGIAAAQAGRREEVDPHRLRSLSYFQLGLRRILLCVLHGEKKLFCCCLLKPMSDPLPVVATRKEFHRRRKMKYPAYLFKTVEFFPLTR